MARDGVAALIRRRSYYCTNSQVLIDEVLGLLFGNLIVAANSTNAIFDMNAMRIASQLILVAHVGLVQLVKPNENHASCAAGGNRIHI